MDEALRHVVRERAGHHCDRFKGPNLTAIDPATATVVPLFHPRLDAWDAHFVVDDVVIVGRTPSGTAPAHHRSRLAEGWRRAPAQCRGYRWLA